MLVFSPGRIVNRKDRSALVRVQQIQLPKVQRIIARHSREVSVQLMDQMDSANVFSWFAVAFPSAEDMIARVPPTVLFGMVYKAEQRALPYLR